MNFMHSPKESHREKENWRIRKRKKKRPMRM
jgi:hypothetical protein